MEYEGSRRNSTLALEKHKKIPNRRVEDFFKCLIFDVFAQRGLGAKFVDYAFHALRGLVNILESIAD
jgi:hypothetical protein